MYYRHIKIVSADRGMTLTFEIPSFRGFSAFGTVVALMLQHWKGSNGRSEEISRMGQGKRHGQVFY